MARNLPNSASAGSSSFQKVVAAFLAGDALPFARILSAERVERVFAKHGCRFGHGVFPPPMVPDKDGKPNLSRRWRKSSTRTNNRFSFTRRHAGRFRQRRTMPGASTTSTNAVVRHASSCSRSLFPGGGRRRSVPNAREGVLKKIGSSGGRVLGPSARDFLRHKSGVQWQLHPSLEACYTAIAWRNSSRVLLTTQGRQGIFRLQCANGVRDPGWHFVLRGRSLEPIGRWTHASKKSCGVSRVPAWSYVQVPFRRMNQKTHPSPLSFPAV